MPCLGSQGRAVAQEGVASGVAGEPRERARRLMTSANSKWPFSAVSAFLDIARAHGHRDAADAAVENSASADLRRTGPVPLRRRDVVDTGVRQIAPHRRSGDTTFII